MLLRTTYTPELFEGVNTYLRERGERWRVMLSKEQLHEPAVLRVPGSKKNERWVVANIDAAWLMRAAAHVPQRPSRAIFEVLDSLALWLRMPTRRRAALLAPLAKQVLAEALAGDRPAVPAGDGAVLAGLAPAAVPPAMQQVVDVGSSEGAGPLDPKVRE
jgi:hypothetical protein